MSGRIAPGVAAVLAAVLAAVTAPVAVRPAGAAYGTTSWSPSGVTAPAVPGTVPEGAGRAFVLRYEVDAADGRRRPATGLVLVPPGPTPAAGWPLVVYGHMTTGAADRCAPSSGRVPPGDDLRRAEQGDALTTRLLSAGVAVARPDFEGLGVAGGHPYLMGGSLGESMVAMVAATSRVLPLEGRWVAAGHSEGAVAALNAGDRRRRSPAGLRLVGIEAITPVTRMERLIEVLQGVPVVVPEATPVLTGLAALLLKGLSVQSPAFNRLLLQEGGLSDRARAVWPHLERRCLAGLGEADSWGGLAPAEILGPRGQEASRLLRDHLARTDVRRLPLRPVPVRIEEGLLDAVAPAPFTELLARELGDRGVDVTLARWAADHSGTNSETYAVPAAAAWILARLGVG